MPGLERPPQGERAAEAVTLALEREVGVRDRLLGQRRDDRLGLRRRHDPVVEALEDQDRGREAVREVARRALAVDGGRLRIRPDQAVVVARFELVAVGVEQLEVADPEVADAGREDVAEGERRQRRVAAGAPALDGQPVRIDVAALDEEPRGRDAVVDVDDAPLPVEALAVLAPVAGAAAVVDVDDGDPAAGQELLVEVERGRGVRRRAAVRQHDERRLLALGAAEVGVGRRVVERVRRPVAGRRELDRLRLGDDRRVERDRARPAQDAGRRQGHRVEAGDDGRVARVAGERDDGVRRRPAARRAR